MKAWTPDEEEILYANPTMVARKLMKLLPGRTENSIRQRQIDLRSQGLLARPPKHVSLKKPKPIKRGIILKPTQIPVWEYTSTGPKGRHPCQWPLSLETIPIPFCEAECAWVPDANGQPVLRAYCLTHFRLAYRTET